MTNEQVVAIITDVVFGFVSHGMSNSKYLNRLSRTGLIRRHERRKRHLKTLAHHYVETTSDRTSNRFN